LKLTLADPFVRLQDELPLSGPALKALLRSTLAQGASFRFQARGFSMSPFIQDGDLICIQSLGARSPGLGQVLAFTPPGSDRLVVHRVVGMNRAGWLVKGDNLAGPGDGLLHRGCLHGRVVSIERSGRALKLGLGPERYAIGLLSRWGLLRPLIQCIQWVRRRHGR
jgi:hypothetical protein